MVVVLCISDIILVALTVFLLSRGAGLSPAIYKRYQQSGRVIQHVGAQLQRGAVQQRRRGMLPSPAPAPGHPTATRVFSPRDSCLGQVHGVQVLQHSPLLPFLSRSFSSSAACVVLAPSLPPIKSFLRAALVQRNMHDPPYLFARHRCKCRLCRCTRCRAAGA